MSHRATLTLNGTTINWAYTCDEPTGAPCRMVCGDGCEEWDFANHEHPFVDVDHCIIATWMGQIDALVEDPFVFWEGEIEPDYDDGYTFEPDLRDEPALTAIRLERRAQDRTWGEQNHPDGTGGEAFEAMREHMRTRCQAAAADGSVTWEHVASEEYFEALAETDPKKLRVELFQLAAVLVNWAGAIDRRG